MLLRSLAAGALAAAALAAPAAADVAYDVDAFTYLNGTAAGSDGDGWSSASSWETEIDQSIAGIPATDDQEVIEAAAPANRLYAHKLAQDYALVTAAGTLSWGCTAPVAPKGAPGSIRITRQGDQGFAELVVAQSITQPRDCTGFSTFADEITITPDPVKAVWNFPWSDLVKGSVSHRIDISVLRCGEWTIYQESCKLSFGGNVTLSRRAAEPQPAEEEPEPTPEPTPWDGDPDVSSPPRPLTPIKQVTPKLTKNGKAAKVKVTCTSACAGKVSATAVARGKQPAAPLGTKRYSSTGGAKTVKVQFIKGGSRTARRRGAVIINVSSGSQSKAVRVPYTR